MKKTVLMAAIFALPFLAKAQSATEFLSCICCPINLHSACVDPSVTPDPCEEFTWSDRVDVYGLEGCLGYPITLAPLNPCTTGYRTYWLTYTDPNCAGAMNSNFVHPNDAGNAICNEGFVDHIGGCGDNCTGGTIYWVGNTIVVGCP